MLENGGKYEHISFFTNRKRGGSIQDLQILTSKCLRLRPNDYPSNIQLIIIINLKERPVIVNQFLKRNKTSKIPFLTLFIFRMFIFKKKTTTHVYILSAYKLLHLKDLIRLFVVSLCADECRIGI